MKVDYGGADGTSVLRTQLVSGTAADVFYVQPGNGTAIAIQTLVPGGFLSDLSDRPFSANVPETFDITTEVDGKRYFLPMGLDGIVAIYNKAEFEALGIDAPQTFDELLEFCDTANAGGKIPFAFGAQAPWVNLLPTYAFVATTVFQQDPEFDTKMAAGDATFVDSNWRLSLEKVLEMQDRGCFQPDPLGTDFAASLPMVANGEAIAAIQVSGVLASFQAAGAEGTEFGAFPVPATNDPSETWIPTAIVGGYAINSAAKNPVAAEKFIDFLAEPENYLAYIKAQSTFAPIPVEGFEPPEEFAFLSDFIESGRTYPWMDQLWPNAQVQPPLIEGTQALLGGGGSIDELLTKMDDAYAEGPSS